MRSCLVLFLFAPAVWGQMLEGDLVDAVSGAPVAGARVALQPPFLHPPTAVSDAGGHFRIAAAGATQPVGGMGALSLAITRPGYLVRQRLVPVGSTNVRIRLLPQAVIAGKVEDEDGFPVDGSVEALQYRLVDGRRELRVVGTARCDDQGRYRIARLSAGRYYVRVSPFGATMTWDGRYGTRYYPDALEPREKDQVEVKTGEERTVNFELRKIEGVTVAGRVRMPDGSNPPRQFHVSSFSGGIQQWSDGRFRMSHVAPGSYKVTAFTGTMSPAPAGEFAGEQNVEVAGTDIRDVTITLHAVEPMDLQGTVVFEDGATPQNILIAVQGQNGQPFSARSGADGSFTLHGLLPGRYTLQQVRPTDLGNHSPEAMPRIVSIKLGERDARSGFTLDSTEPGVMRVTMSAAPLATVRVSLRDAAGQPVIAGFVMLQPRGSGNGAARVSGLDGIAQVTAPAGEYRIYGLADDIDSNLLQDADWLRAHENDFPILRLASGTNAPLTVTLRQ